MALRLRTLLLALPLALLLAACGGGGAFTLESLAQAADRTRDEGSSRVEIVSTVTVGGETMESRGEGAFDYAGNRGTMTMQVPEAGGAMDVRVVDGVSYVRLPEAERAQLPEGATWVRVEDEAGASTGFEQQSPADVLDFLRASDSEPEEVGTEEVRGVETTHYRAQLDIRRMAEQDLERVPEEHRERMRRDLQQLLQLLEEPTVPVELWVDDDGLLRRMELRMAMQVPGPTGEPTALELTQRMELFDYGVEVDVEAPPEDEVVDAAELEQQPSG